MNQLIDQLHNPELTEVIKNILLFQDEVEVTVNKKTEETVDIDIYCQHVSDTYLPIMLKSSRYVNINVSRKGKLVISLMEVGLK